MSVIISRRWLKKHATGEAGWNKRQLAILGVSWPTKKGWLSELIDHEIDDDVAERFIAAKTKESVQARHVREVRKRRKAVCSSKNDLLELCRARLGCGPVKRRLVVEALGRHLRVPVPVTREEQFAWMASFVGVSWISERSGEEVGRVTIIHPRRERRPRRKNYGDLVTDPFLSSYEWRTLRMVVLKKRGARCECCGATAKDGVRINVDHVKPRRQFPELALSEENLQVLCEECNAGKGSWDQTDWRGNVPVVDPTSPPIRLVKRKG